MGALRIAALVVLAGVLAGGAYGAYRVYDYVEHDVRFCGSCHVMEHAWETWATGPHQEVACKTCHHQDLQARARIVVSWATGRGDSIGPHTQLDRSVCASCHLSNDPKWKQIAQTAGHSQHAEEADLQCLACHLPSLHAVEPAVENCQRCHEKAQTNLGGMKDFHCTTCHNFLAEGEHHAALKPMRETCLECHQGLQLRGETFPEHGPMAFACGECHKPHTQAAPTFADCLGCHADVAQPGAHLEHQAVVDCVGCHKPHDWKAQGWGAAAGG